MGLSTAPAVFRHRLTPQSASVIEGKQVVTGGYLRPTDQTMNRPMLLDQVRAAIRLRHYSLRTENTYLHWIKRFIAFHNNRHPTVMGEQEIEQFLSMLAVEQHVSASTQNQAFNALLFLYRHVLDRSLSGLDNVVRAKQPQRLPVVLRKHEVKAVLDALEGVPWLMGHLLYGAGLRLMECLRLHEVVLQRAVRRAAQQVDLIKPVGCHTLRPACATPAVEGGMDLATLQQLLGHDSITTTRRSVHVAPRHAPAQGSPRESLPELAPSR